MKVEGRFVRREREVLGLSHMELAEESGITVHELRCIEDEVPLDLPEAIVERLATALGITAEDLRKEG